MESGGDRNHLDIEGDVHGQIVIGRNNRVTARGETHAVDLPRLIRFAEAVMDAVPVLRLAEDQGHTALALAADVLAAASQPEPDHRRLRAVGHSLRTIIEGAAAGALSSGLLAIWHP
jgi:hypothetical protein